MYKSGDEEDLSQDSSRGWKEGDGLVKPLGGKWAMLATRAVE